MSKCLRWWLVALLAVTFLVVLAGCGGGKQQAKTGVEGETAPKSGAPAGVPAKEQAQGSAKEAAPKQPQAAAKPADKKELDKIIIGYPTPGITDMPILLADRKGYFKEEGLAVEAVVMKTDLATKGLVTGDVDFVTSWGSAMRGAMQGLDLKGVLVVYNKPTFSLITQPEIKTVADLRGKRIAIMNVMSSDWLSVRMILQASGVDAAKETTPLNVGGSQQRFQALQSKEADACVLVPPFTEVAEKAGFKRLVDAADVYEMPMTGFVTSAAKVKDQPQQIKALARAILRAMQFMKQNKAETIAMITKEYNVDQATATSAYGIIEKAMGDGLANKAGVLNDVQAALVEFKQADFNAEAFTDKFLDFRYTVEAQKELGLK